MSTYQTYSGPYTGSFGGSGGNVSTSPPTGLTTGDIWVICAFADTDTGSGSISVPSGFTAVSDAHRYSNLYPLLRSFYKEAGASESAVDVAFGSGCYDCQTVSLRVSSADTLDIVSSEAESAGGASPQSLDAPDVTVSENSSVAVLVFGCHVESGSASTISEPSGSTAVVKDQSGYPQWGIAYEARSAGSYAPGNWTATSAGKNCTNLTALTFVLYTAASGGGIPTAVLLNANQFA